MIGGQFLADAACFVRRSFSVGVLVTGHWLLVSLLVARCSLFVVSPPPNCEIYNSFFQLLKIMYLICIS